MPSAPPSFIGECGAAFRLRAPTVREFSLAYRDALVSTNAGSRDLTVQLNSAVPFDQLHAQAWEHTQQALDSYAATDRVAIATIRGEHEYALWRLAADGYEVIFTDTHEATWNVTGSGAVANADRTVPAPSPSGPIPTAPFVRPHHQALRFLRLSLLSEDLSDAYRNAYLALECLVSDESQQQRSESELHWLKRVLNGPLRGAVPEGLPIGLTIDDLYNDGRLLLFHAKTGRRFYEPHSIGRDALQARYLTLSAILMNVIRIKLGQGYPAGWTQFSQALIDARARAGFAYDEIVLRTDTGGTSVRPTVRIIDNPRRFGNPWARLAFEMPRGINVVQGAIMRLSGQDRFWDTDPIERVASSVARVVFEFNFLDYNVRSPRPAHQT